MVECFLAKEDVAGSTPVSRSNFPSFCDKIQTTVRFQLVTGLGGLHRANGCGAGARYPSGKGEVCKTFMRRFDPDPRLHQISNLDKTSRPQSANFSEIVGTFNVPLFATFSFSCHEW